MAFNSTPPRAEYIATSGQTVFPFLFKVYEETDIVVYQETSPSDPVLLLLTTDYTVTINGDAGGDITLVSGATLDDSVTILRSLPVNRDVDYQTGGDLLADTLDMDQDYQTYLIADQVDRITALEAGDVAVSSFVLKTGDAMIGQLKGITPIDTNDLTRKDYVDGKDALRLLLTGGTVTGQIKGITPIDANDLTRKDYVDAAALEYDEAKSLTTNGYQKFSNGFIVQWGIATTTATFPIAFPNACLQAVAINTSSYDTNEQHIPSFTTTTLTFGTATREARYIAIGY